MTGTRSHRKASVPAVIFQTSKNSNRLDSDSGTEREHPEEHDINDPWVEVDLPMYLFDDSLYPEMSVDASLVSLDSLEKNAPKRNQRPEPTPDPIPATLPVGPAPIPNNYFPQPPSLVAPLPTFIRPQPWIFHDLAWPILPINPQSLLPLVDKYGRQEQPQVSVAYALDTMEPATFHFYPTTQQVLQITSVWKDVTPYIDLTKGRNRVVPLNSLIRAKRYRFFEQSVNCGMPFSKEQADYFLKIVDQMDWNHGKRQMESYNDVSDAKRARLL